MIYRDTIFDYVEESSFESSKYLIPIDEYVSYDVVNEAARYRFFPKIRQNNDLRKVWNDCKKAEALLNANGTPTRKDVIDFFAIALRIVTAIDEMSTLVYLPACLLIVPIPAYLIARAIIYCERLGEDALGKAKAEQIRNKLLYTKNKCKDAKVRAEIDEQIERIDKSLEKLEYEDWDN